MFLMTLILQLRNYFELQPTLLLSKLLLYYFNITVVNSQFPAATYFAFSNRIFFQHCFLFRDSAGFLFCFLNSLSDVLRWGWAESSESIWCPCRKDREEYDQEKRGEMGEERLGIRGVQVWVWYGFRQKSVSAEQSPACADDIIRLCVRVWRVSQWVGSWTDSVFVCIIKLPWSPDNVSHQL